MSENSDRCQCLTTKGTQCSRLAKELTRYCYQHQSCQKPLGEGPESVPSRPIPIIVPAPRGSRRPTTTSSTSSTSSTVTSSPRPRVSEEDVALQKAIMESMQYRSTLEQAQAVIARHAKETGEKSRTQVLQDAVDKEVVRIYEFMLPRLPFWANYPINKDMIRPSYTNIVFTRFDPSEYENFLRQMIESQLYNKTYNGLMLSDELKEEIANVVLKWLESENAVGIVPYQSLLRKV